MTTAPLAEVHNADRFGGKAVQLGLATRAGLPVPDGYAIDWEFVEAMASGDPAACSSLRTLCAKLPGPLAVRSSAVGEDSSEASFAGQHVTRLNVLGFDAVRIALEEVWRSGRSDGAKAYRMRMGADPLARVGVVFQRLVAADVAGVMFTCDPVSGRPEIVIEAGWGLGEAIVQGLVIPDRYRIAGPGNVLERRPGTKSVAIRLAADGGVYHETVSSIDARRLCLGYGDLRALQNLATRCDAVFGPEPHDIEWASHAGQLFLLQRRPVTQMARKSPLLV